MSAGEFAGRRVLVTGGARGIGLATARRLVDEGADVVVTSRSEPPADLDAAWIAADLSTADGVSDLADAVLADGAVDVLVQNAAVLTEQAPALETRDDAWTADLAVNYLGIVRLDRRIVPAMVGRGRGVVVHVSSISSRLPTLGQASYGASKAALGAYSKTLAMEVGASGVRVVNILPGFIESEGLRSAIAAAAEAQGVGFAEMERMAIERQSIPIARPGTPADVAEVIAFLASDRAGYVTAAEYRVDGGIIPTV